MLPIKSTIWTRTLPPKFRRWLRLSPSLETSRLAGTWLLVSRSLPQSHTTRNSLFSLTWWMNAPSPSCFSRLNEIYHQQSWAYILSFCLFVCNALKCNSYNCQPNLFLTLSSIDRSNFSKIISSKLFKILKISRANVAKYQKRPSHMPLSLDSAPNSTLIGLNLSIWI